MPISWICQSNYFCRVAFSNWLKIINDSFSMQLDQISENFSLCPLPITLASGCIDEQFRETAQKVVNMVISVSVLLIRYYVILHIACHLRILASAERFNRPISLRASGLPNHCRKNLPVFATSMISAAALSSSCFLSGWSSCSSRTRSRWPPDWRRGRRGGRCPARCSPSRTARSRPRSPHRRPWGWGEFRVL